MDFDFAQIHSHVDNGVKLVNDGWTWLQTRSDLTTKLTSALIILVLTLIVSGFVSDAMKRAARRFIHHEAERTLPEFISQVVRWIILLVGLVAVLNQMGVQTTSFVAVLGAASLAIGLAFQGTLGNVAAGLVMLFSRPYRIGDTVRFEGISGRVHRLGLFMTEIDTVENIRAFIPNSKIFSNEFQNISTNGAVRVELFVDVDYAANLEKVVELVRGVLSAHPDRLPNFEAWAGLHEFRDSGISVRLFIWVPPSRALDVKSQLIIDIKKALDANGIEIPYPHQVEISRP